MDGTLVDSRVGVERTWRRWAVLHGLDPEPLFRSAQGRRTRDSLADIVPAADLDREVAWLDAAEFEDLEGTVEIPGAGALLRTLPPASWAVVTSAGRELALRRLAAAALPAPGVLVTSEDVIRGKPAPDCYLLAAVRFGVAAAECVVFEDAAPGIAAGLAAGAQVVALTTTLPIDRIAGAHGIITDYRGVRIRQAGLDYLVDIP